MKTQSLKRSWPSLVVFAVVSVAVVVYSLQVHYAVSLIGVILMGILTAKLGLAFSYRPITGATPRLDVVIVMAMFNEDPGTVAESLKSFLRQTVLPQKVVVVDDGSSTRDAVTRVLTFVEKFARVGIELFVIELSENRGKREALGEAFVNHRADVYVCVDSDTVLDENAIREVCIPFNDSRVNVVTGLVLAANRNKNLLTRLINLRYGNAFAFERAAYSRLGGSVLCACGSLAAYRSSIVHENLEDFLGQKFLGVPAVFGDDRRMTNYGLMTGRAVYQETAIAYTAVPERISHFVRQQVRWNKSFFRESLWVLHKMPQSKVAWWITLEELVMWVVLTSLLGLSVVRMFTGAYDSLIYIGYVILFGYARSVRYLDLPGTNSSTIERLAAFSLAPVYGVIHIVVLIPIRIWSLLTLRRGRWGTRSKVEVSLEEQ